VNPPRRDTVNLPGNGFVVLAFETDNPGVWILHCHIEWHLHNGFAMSMMKGPRGEVAGIWSGEREEMKRGCERWRGSGLEGRE